MDCQQPNNLNDYHQNLVQFNLYIDHQQLAPLIRQLEDTLSQAESQAKNHFSKLELREIIYQEFVTIINTLYEERFKEIKLEEQLPPMPQHEEQFYQKLMLRPKEQRNNRGNEVEENKQPFGRNTVKTRAVYSLQVQIELIQWIISCNKNTFDHKQIVEKYCEISKGTKKRLSINNIFGLLEKYNLKHIIVRGKQGKEHFLRQQIDKEPSIVVKEEEFSKIITTNHGQHENTEGTEQSVKKDDQVSSEEIQAKSAFKHYQDAQFEEQKEETAHQSEIKGKK